MSPTRSSTPRLSEVARHLVVPSGIVATEFPSVQAECLRMGVAFDEWQSGLAALILAKRADGTYAASIGGVTISIPRQVGKTFLIGAVVFALCILHPGMTVIWTAHQLRTADETFRSMQALANRAKVRPHVSRILLGSGDETVEFTNGSRILFGARERGFGLGFATVDVLVLDEAQRMTEKVMEDLVPTTNQARNPLVLLMGTPPRPTDPGEVFKARRREALTADPDDNDTLYVEFSADSSVNPDQWAPGHVDWPAVATANPSYPRRTPRTAILRMLRLLGALPFRREGLGIWDEDDAGTRLISADQWRAIGVTGGRPDGVQSFGVAFSASGTQVSLAGAVKHDDGVHVELGGAQSGPTDLGVAALADWLAEPQRMARTASIAVAGAAGAPALVAALRARGVRSAQLHTVTTGEYLAACSMFYDAVKGGTVTRLESPGQAALDASVGCCDKKTRQGGGWGWQATTTDGDETPLEAVSLAYWAAVTTKRRPGRKSRVVVM